jgi:hypothetical protein
MLIPKKYDFNIADTKTTSLMPVKKKRSSLWFEKIMVLLVLVNYLLVLFDFTYIPLRNFWLEGRIQLFIKLGSFERYIPQDPIVIPTFQITKYYDWVKGIEPYRDTENYLKEVELLSKKINQQGLQSPKEAATEAVTSAQNIDIILANLREKSVEMIERNPFQSANKTGTLERIKNKMREHVFGTKDASAKSAFKTFWSRSYLAKKGFREELDFFDNQIKPLIATNYFRAVDENGEPVNNFALLDFPFFIIFLVEFLARTWYISRRHAGLNWFDAMLWRWYDIFLLLPFFRLLRIIPLVMRLNQARLIDLENVEKQTKQGFVASIAEDITQVVVMQVINQIQRSITKGELRNLLLQRTINPYIDLNEINETAEIIRIISQFTVYDVLPKVKPDIEELIKYNISAILSESSAYKGLEKLPGVKSLENQLAGQLAAQIFQTVLDVLTNLVKEDAVFDKLVAQLVDKLRQTMATELQATQSFEQIESLLAALLEEIKINYVKRLSQEDIEQILEQTRTLRQTG